MGHNGWASLCGATDLVSAAASGASARSKTRVRDGQLQPRARRLRPQWRAIVITMGSLEQASKAHGGISSAQLNIF